MKKRGNQTFGLTGALCPLNRAEDDGTARSKQVLNASRERDLGCGELQMFFGLRRGGGGKRGEERRGVRALTVFRYVCNVHIKLTNMMMNAT